MIEHGVRTQDTEYNGSSAEVSLLLRMNQRMLILPQSSVSKAHHLSDDEIVRIHAAGRVLQRSTIRNTQTAWFAALSDELTLLPILPKERFVLTTFIDYPDIYWCWRDLYQISRGDYEYFDLPDVICTPETPVHALAVFGRKHRAFFTSTHDLVRFVLQEINE